jgi:hypothetical protein
MNKIKSFHLRVQEGKHAHCTHRYLGISHEVMLEVVENLVHLALGDLADGDGLGVGYFEILRNRIPYRRMLISEISRNIYKKIATFRNNENLGRFVLP